MATRSIDVQYQPATTGEAEGTRPLSVRLEQAGLPDIDELVNLGDIYQMLLGAWSGISAQSLPPEDCPFSYEDGVVTVALDFYAWPTALDLDYGVTASIGTLGEPVRIEIEKEFDQILDHTDLVTLPYYLEGAQLTWQSPAFDRNWRVIDRPTVTMDGSTLRLSEPVFGVMRIKATAVGYLHTVRISLVKQEETEDEDGNLNMTGYKIENLQCTVTASWIDENGKFQTFPLDLEVPECVKDFLDECPGGGAKGSAGPTPERPYVYYNTCTGQVILVLYE